MNVTPLILRLGCLAGLLSVLAGSLCATTQQTLDPWTSTLSDLDVPREEIVPDDAVGNMKTVLYLQNLASPRVGTDSDADIIQSFLDQGLMVITMDFQHHPQARVPYLCHDILKMRTDVLYAQFGNLTPMEENWVYIVPEGCKLLRNIVYYKSLAKRLDIVYPANPILPTGTLIEFTADVGNRMGNGSFYACNDTILPAMASEGFAVAIADHPGFTSDSGVGISIMPDGAMAAKNAVRAVRAQSDALHLNGRIATLGFSKGSAVAMVAVTAQNKTVWEVAFGGNVYSVPDYDTYASFTDYPTVSPELQGAVIMSGYFTYLDLPAEYENVEGLATIFRGTYEEKPLTWEQHSALDYSTTAPAFPLFLEIKYDGEGWNERWQMDNLRAELTARGGSYVYRVDTEEPIGHKMPLDHTIINDLNRYLREQLMLPNPYTVMEGLTLYSTGVGGLNLEITHPGPFPPADYGLEWSPNLEDWTSVDLIRPDAAGAISQTLPASALDEGFYRLGPPPDPAP